ncbi:MAG: alanine--tRNA ligase-related protein, partial [Candidatus Aenigmatarchaeota archaeon]
MLTKDGLRAKFSRDWKKQYEVELFRQKGFVRKQCVCGKHFWTLDPDRKLCGDTSCENYGFIGRPITKARWDYIKTWKEFEKFFVKAGHTSVKRYPVVDRWRPDLYFTIASIQDFQRIDKGKMVFEYPADPLVVPQVCLRFPDIPNVGVTGTHHTSFIMPGQHAFGSYWKDRCIELNFEFLNKVMGIPEKELIYVEDVWAMTDFSAFGPSVETLSRGCELVNSVFMQYTKTNGSYKELPQKVIDVGWGHERLAWFSNGTPTTYDIVFGPVTDWMKKQTGLKPGDVFHRYSVLAGKLNFDEIQNLKKAKLNIARELGIEPKNLHALIEPLQALYAIADHIKTLLFAVTDGSIPSNVGGGYNLRVLLRRSLGFMKEFGFDFDLMDIAERHARHLKPLSPELKDGLAPLAQILEVEQARHQKTLERAAGLVQRELKKGKIPDKKLTQLYTSNGVTPELVEKIAHQEGVPFSIPDDFYARLTAQHEAGEKEHEKELLDLDVRGLPPTKKLFYDKPTQTKFKARVLKRLGDWIVLDQTLFYPTGGGQPSD